MAYCSITNHELVEQVKILTEQVKVLQQREDERVQNNQHKLQRMQELQRVSQKPVINDKECEQRDKNGWGVGKWSYLTPWD